MAVVLDAGQGACLSHDTACARYGVPGFREAPIHVWRVRDRSEHREKLGIQHKTRRLPDHHMLVLRGVPMTTPARTFIDQAAHLSAARAGRLLDDFWGRDLLGFSAVDRTVRDLSRQGRTGLVLARDLLHERGPSYRPPESRLERRVMRLLRKRGLGPFDRQVDVGDDEGWIGRVDFRHRELPLILEVQSDLYHQGLTNRRGDELRLQRLRAGGFAVVELFEDDIWYRPDVALRLVAEAVSALTRRSSARSG